jgi:hypothetical protein
MRNSKIYKILPFVSIVLVATVLAAVPALALSVEESGTSASSHAITDSSGQSSGTVLKPEPTQKGSVCVYSCDAFGIACKRTCYEQPTGK